MWIVTPIGFWSTVCKDGDQHLTIRARIRSDLDRLRQFVPELSPVATTPENDYGYRCTVPREAFALGVARLSLDTLTYPNFKKAAGKELGEVREQVYHRVWAALQELAVIGEVEAEFAERRRLAAARKPARRRRSGADRNGAAGGAAGKVE